MHWWEQKVNIGTKVFPSDRAGGVRLDILKAQLQLMPEWKDMLQQRYQILYTIALTKGIGRRTIADILKLSEREVRKEFDQLRAQGLIHVSREGAEITETGQHTLVSLKVLVDEWSGRHEKESKLKRLFGIQEVHIVAGNSDESEQSQTLLADEAARWIYSHLNSHMITAVTGGTTIAKIADHLPQTTKFKQLQFIAARGGIGKDVQLQANTIAALFAEKLSGSYKTLYIPDRLSESSYDAMKQEPFVQEMMDLYEQMSILVHGIGDASEMARRRSSSSEELRYLQQHEAVSEAFGYYFNSTGQVVHRIRTIGVQLEQLEQTPYIVAVAGGAQKAQALESYFQQAPKQTVLITDEGAADQLIQALTH